ncbi:unnamed protein product [Paramecium sonneborni]|uniref:Uncharacterized protein n=1 Tax=Paramecium sonneborni TaxID=65129 RepID=A0A8S1R1F7_9CILI|nr:unnamed protein product [Paramecium sonneborni]
MLKQYQSFNFNYTQKKVNFIETNCRDFYHLLNQYVKLIIKFRIYNQQINVKKYLQQKGINLFQCLQIIYTFLYLVKSKYMEELKDLVSWLKYDNQFIIQLFQHQFVLNFSILIDCYQNNELFLIQIKDEQQKIAYFISSSIPASTKIQSILNGPNPFLVYAQYVEKYSIFSLLSSSFQNQSSLNQYQFIDFDIPITITPNIYAITHKQIFQLSISSDSTFSYKYNFNSTSMSNFTIINAFYNFWSYSQCD